jgi:DNA-binding NarL/FixJ family response regulator
VHAVDVAGDAPVLLIVEDAHWLDPPTADVLAFVARRIESDPVVLLAATRDGYPSALADAGLPEHRLAGLDDATAAALLDAAAPGLPLAARNRVLREADGNPLALLELPALAARPEDEPSLPGGLPLTERLERAFAAQLAATGLSNREIGQRLYLSHRTISTHLYRVFPKLGITSRGELGAALAPSAETR